MVAVDALIRQITTMQRLAEDRILDATTPLDERTAAEHVVRRAKGLKKALDRWARIVDGAPTRELTTVRG